MFAPQKHLQRLGVTLPPHYTISRLIPSAAPEVIVGTPRGFCTVAGLQDGSRHTPGCCLLWPPVSASTLFGHTDLLSACVVIITAVRQVFSFFLISAWMTLCSAPPGSQADLVMRSH